MSLEVVVPEVSDGVKSGTVISVAVAVGDLVEEDQTLLELETDKAVVAIPSPAAGKVLEIRVGEGDTAEVGAVIAVLDVANASATSEKPATATPVPPAAVVAAEPEPTEPPKAAVSPASALPVADPAPLDLSRIRRDNQVAPAAPVVRRIARDLGVDIYQVQGSGPGGRISEQDVRNFVRETMTRLRGGQPQVAASEFRGLHAQRPLPDFARWGEVEREKLSRVREITADAMAYAWSTVPMVTQYDRVDVGALERFRQQYNAKAAKEAKLTMTAILLKACATALKLFPQFNSSLDMAARELVLKKYVHIGVAVDTPNGLLVPVLRDVDRKGIATLATELNDVAVKTRERKISPADLDGGCFTISNLGGIGGTSFTPIVYAPQVAILGVSRTETVARWNEAHKQFLPKDEMPLSLTYDHRVIDGADGARFLRWICEALENPLNLVMK